MITTSCISCGRKWTGYTEAHCATCCAHFTSDAAFDRHLGPTDGGPDCFDPSTLKVKKGRRKGAPLFEQIERSHGPVWRLDDDRQHHYRQNAPRLDEADFSGPNRPGVDLGVPA